MGLLTSNPPLWHPAPESLRQISKAADEICIAGGTSLAAVALHYGLRSAKQHAHPYSIPIVLGLSKLDEVHEVMRVLHCNCGDGVGVLQLEEKVKGMYRDVGYDEWSWASPPSTFS
jgi:D-arabinose 1-dehydrogenase